MTSTRHHLAHPSPLIHPERFVDSGSARLCTQAFGDPAHVPIVLVHGACASMLCWETDFCVSLASRDRYVIRFDNRDTGRSTTCPPGQPDYTLRDLATDVLAVMDGYGLHTAHVVGRSMSGGTVLILGVDHPERVASLTFVATTSGDDDLPAMSDTFLAAVQDEPDFDSPESVLDYTVSVLRAYAGTSPLFDEEAARALAIEDIARTGDIRSALTNHFAIDVEGPRRGGFDDVDVPCLVIHGAVDPVFPREHGEALAAHLDAELLLLPETGHDLPRPHWPLIITTLHAHTQGGSA